MADSVAATIRRNAYVDSISLLQVSAELLSLAGVLDAALVMATDLNRQVLDDAGLLADDARSAGPNDLVIAVRASDAASAGAALQQATALLASRRSPTGGGDGAARAPARSLRSAHRADPEANLAVISVPGRFAASEARQALADGLHVFLFSDHVSLEDEVDLKRLARDRDLLVMGPDCGTSILNGVGLGFANVVRRGRIGIVGASGTGIQEVASLIHQRGEGISHAIGTGGRDLSADVGGSTTLQAIQLLANDPTTEVIVVLGKQPAREVARHVLRAAIRTRKAVVACLSSADTGEQLADADGERLGDDEGRASVQIAGSLDQAANQAAFFSPSTWTGMAPEDLPRIALRETQRQIRGLFCGGTLCSEAAAVAGWGGVDIHEFIDFGDDRYTQGRAHPMIDPTLRNRAIVEAGADPQVGVVLLDVILGLGSHADPAGATLPAVREAFARAEADGRQLSVIAHVVGTDWDPQGLGQQEALLRAAGVHLFESNSQAAMAAKLLLEGVAV